MRTYVLDTSVLLSDPHAIRRFAEHAVVLPVVVITELEGKRHHPELGYFARSALRLLDSLRAQHGRLDRPIPLNEQGGTLRVELNGSDDQVLPAGMRLGDNDTRILSAAVTLANGGAEVIVVSKDLPMRIKAASVGLAADEYRHELASEEVYTGMVQASLTEEEMSALWGKERLGIEGLVTLESVTALSGQPAHTGATLSSPRGSALATIVDGELRLVAQDREIFGVRGRSAEQRVAIDHLLNPDIGIVSLGGRAGTGKSALALAAGLEAVVSRREQRKVMVFRPLYAVGGQTLGFLPGDTEEKMQPWGEAVFDTLCSVVPKERVDRVVSLGQLEVLPLTHIRGRSLHDAFVIVDEAQSLERGVLLTVLSRIGHNAKVVLTHDVAQRDNLRVGRWDGVASVVESLKGKDLFAHIDLVRTERSEIAELVTKMLDEVPQY
ncbi:PhoH-like protein [Actinomyces bovis]|uniref:PhoH-like protein n=1 Tax=Actinomyces bovis TaxID=1658 RepID=A0ABY1VM48_9ACTO|nr:PhoH family protein [Actinomyces bovis]SPT53171.1 PhoH-like protein [Actinomyces bovis]VEG52368.1 PhoH-like protein [Actinomyces israelii]